MADETLERETELDVIAAGLEAAAGGEGRMLVIEGSAGIGKTRLVHDARALAKARGFARIQATGDELERTMAWSVIRQLVERSILRYSGETRQALLEGPSGRALRAMAEAPDEAAPSGDAAAGRTAHALWWVAADLASFRPLLITVDDAQWADVPSLRFLAYLARRIADLPILVVIGTRPPQGVSGPLTDLLSVQEAGRLQPRPLSEEAVGELAAGDGAPPAPEVSAAVHAASGGNPFLAGLLLGELRRRGMELGDAATAERVGTVGPSAISRALLARLPEDATALASAAAVLGANSQPRLAGRVARLEGERLARATDLLVDGHVLADGGGEEQLAFVHPVVREAVLAQLSRGERAELHARAARTLHETGASSSRVAAHLVAAPTGTLDGAAVVLAEAGLRLLGDGDPSGAAAHLTRALEETPHDDALQTQLGFALMRAGEPVSAREHLRAAAAAVPEGEERSRRLAAAASATAMSDGPAAAVAELRARLETEHGPATDPARLILEARLAEICAFLPEESGRSAERLSVLGDLPGDTRVQRAILSLAAQRARYDVRPAAEARALAERALGDGAMLEDAATDGEGFVSWLVAVMALLAAEGNTQAAEEVARARARIRDYGSQSEFGLVSAGSAWVAWRNGDVRAAEADSDAALSALSVETASPPLVAARITALHCWILTALERGDRSGAAEALNAYDAASGGLPSVTTASSLREARALVALAHDRPEEALREAKLLGEEVRAQRTDTPTLAWRAAAALAANALGRTEDACAFADEQLALAERTGAATDIGAALRVRARVGPPEERVVRLEAAVAALEESPARLELAKALVDLGAALRVERQRAAAHAPLERAVELAIACHAAALRRRALDGLAALGDRPRKLMFSGEESLTASERRVAELAIDGRTNRTIAQELFVTPKTVENHLGRVYVKLGISGRRQLAESLA